MRGSSIHFEKTKSNSADETTRKFEANYLLSKEYRKNNEYWTINNLDAKEVDKKIFNAIMNNAKGKGKRPALENSLYEAVVNLDANHTMEDLKRLAEHIKKELGFTCTRIAIHRDEGHIKETENRERIPIYNYHAHLNFVTIAKDENSKSGIKQMWRPMGTSDFKWKQILSKLQTDAANILGMQRGISGGIRLNHREFRKAKKAQKNSESLFKKSSEIEKLILKQNKGLFSKKEVIDRVGYRHYLETLQKHAYINAEAQVRQSVLKETEKRFQETLEKEQTLNERELFIEQRRSEIIRENRKLDSRQEQIIEKERKLRELAKNTDIDILQAENKRLINKLKEFETYKAKSIAYNEICELYPQKQNHNEIKREIQTTNNLLAKQKLDLERKENELLLRDNQIKELETKNKKQKQELETLKAELDSENTLLKLLTESIKTFYSLFIERKQQNNHSYDKGFSLLSDILQHYIKNIENKEVLQNKDLKEIVKLKNQGRELKESFDNKQKNIIQVQKGREL